MIRSAIDPGRDDGGKRPISRAAWEQFATAGISRASMRHLWGCPPPDLARRWGWQVTPIEAALGQAMAAWAGELAPAVPHPPARIVVLGDPQASLHRLFAHLAHQGLLTDDGWLRPDIGLVCIGDYSDFAADDLQVAAYHGVLFLAWLAAHPATQVVLLLGNHDIERLACLGACSQAAYQAARAAYPDLRACPTRDQRRTFLRSWADAHPAHPPIVAAHGYGAFVPTQRDILRRLLLAGRMHLAAQGTDEQGRSVLLTHAGVTTRERDLLGGPGDAAAWVHALQGVLAAAIARVRPAWEAGQPAPLDLAPCYTGWEQERPNGGLLIHRPDARASSVDPHTELGLDPPRAPRAVDSAAFLLPGLHQVVGHTIAARRLVHWLAPRVSAAAIAAPAGQLLWLRPAGQSWLLDQRSPDPVDRSMSFVDIGLARTTPQQVASLWLQSVVTLPSV